MNSHIQHGKSRISRFTSVITLLIVSIPLFSGEINIELWFKEEIRTPAYSEIYPDLEIIFNSMVDDGIPESLFLDKIREGSLKRVPPARLLRALEDEAVRLRQADRILSGLDIDIFSTDEEVSLYRGISILLSGGFSSKIIKELIKTSDLKENRTDYFLAAGHALLGVQAVTQLSEDNFQKLGIALIQSDLPFQVYSAIASLFLKGMVQRLTPETILEMITDILNRGGGIVQMERELNRRSSHR